MPTVVQRIQHAWNAFRDRDPTVAQPYDLGPSYASRPDRKRLRMGTEKSIVSAVYNRIGIDVASVPIQHVRLDQNGSYLETIDSGLNNCFTLDANIDQTGRALIQDVVMSMFDEGCVAIVPVDTTVNPNVSNAWDVQTLRTGRILEWYPFHVNVELYNEQRGVKENIILAKRDIAIIENPLYAVMNEPNSILKRLIYKLNILDAIDEQSGSGKLDLIIQLPYVIKTPERRKQAEVRRQDIEAQLSGSKYGIAYTDGTEKVTQLNRPAENNLMAQIEYLTSMLYSQLGITETVLAGTADEKTMINYHNRSVEPILSAIADEGTRKFLTKTARSQGQVVKYFKDPFSLVPASQLGALVQSLTGNAVLTSNDFRSVLGYKPSDQPVANQLSNKSLYPPSNPVPVPNQLPIPVNEPAPLPMIPDISNKV